MNEETKRRLNGAKILVAFIIFGLTAAIGYGELKNKVDSVKDLPVKVGKIEQKIEDIDSDVKEIKSEQKEMRKDIQENFVQLLTEIKKAQ